MDRYRAHLLLSECTGDDLWSADYCRQRGIPEPWIEELLDCYESGFENRSQTIFVGDEVVTQYEGVRDVDIAIKLAEYLGHDIRDILETTMHRSIIVRRIREKVEEE
ncbi:MAG: hypothetical protein U0905_16875 [Pirellulales bacterium]